MVSIFIPYYWQGWSHSFDYPDDIIHYVRHPGNHLRFFGGHKKKITMQLEQTQFRKIKQFIRYAIKRKQSGEDYFNFQRFQGQLIIARIKEYMNLDKPISILDVGSGIGGYVYELAQMEDAYVVSLDKNPLPIALQRYQQISRKTKKGKLHTFLKKNAKIVLNSNKIAVIEGDITQSPLRDDVFDIIIASGVIEHVKDQDKMIKECHRMLKKDGLFYLSFPPYYSPTGGHSISPFHYLPGKIPFLLYKKFHIKDHESFVYYGLIKTTLRSIKKQIKGLFDIVDITPRLFNFLKPFLAISIVNEVISHHVEFLLKKI